VIATLAHAQRLERDGDRWRLYLSEGAPLPVSAPHQDPDVGLKAYGGLQPS